jgi:lysophospholipase L1-like esterase
MFEMTQFFCNMGMTRPLSISSRRKMTAISSRPSKAESLYSWAMLPVYICQGLRVRARTHRMPPPHSNGTYEFEGQGETLRILIVGDSSAAGVGVDNISKSFGYFLPAFLNERSGRPVIARIAGMNSATSAQIRDFVVPHIDPRSFHFIALNIGTNDAKNFHHGRSFCRSFGTLLYALKARFPEAVIIWSGVINMENVPALPSPLNRILGIRSRMIDSLGRRLCQERGVLAPEPEWRVIPENFSHDGFHASEAGYREWASNMAAYILALEAEKHSQKSALPSMV